MLKTKVKKVIDKQEMMYGYMEMAEINLALSQEGFNAEEEVATEY